MPDLDTAMEVIDFYVEKKLEKPNSSMTKGLFLYCCQQLYAIDILKEYLQKHWFEAPPSDIIYNFIKERKLLKAKLKDDQFQKIVYKLAKDIFYYFI